MTAAGSAVTVKLYPDSGHFPHNDQPELFADDLLEFVTLGRVQGGLDPKTRGLP